MLIRSLDFPFAHRPAKSLGCAAQNVAARAFEATAQPPRLSLVARKTADSPGRVELLNTEAAAGRRAAWADLVRRSLEPNVFLEPGFALPAAQHIPSRRPEFLFVTGPSAPGEPGELIGLMALQLPRGGRRGLARAWCPAQAALGLPLLDRHRGGEALELMLDWLNREEPGVSAVLFPCLPTGGAVMKLLRRQAAACNRPLLSTNRRARALLIGRSDGEAPSSHHPSRKHRKEIRRQRRRLAEVGKLAYVRYEATDVRRATERFLALEASGWKNACGTALLNDPGLATFTRSMARLLACQGKCRIDSLEHDGAPLAMGIILTSGERAFLWKIAYDERFANLSPGVQFILDFTLRQRTDRNVSCTDSCAVPDHPMIDRLWPDRLEIADVLLAPSAAGAKAFAAAAGREELRRRCRGLAKRVYYRILGRQPS